MKKLFKFILIVLVFFLILIGGLFLLLNKPKKVDTKFNNDDYENFIEKINIDGTENNVIKIDNVTITDSELAAFLNNKIDKTIMYDINVDFDQNTIILAFKAGDKIEELYKDSEYKDLLALAEGKQIYWNLSLAVLLSKQIAISTNSIYVGSIKIPIQYVEEQLNDLIDQLNNGFEKSKDLEISNLKIVKDSLTFTGTIPKEIDF